LLREACAHVTSLGQCVTAAGHTFYLSFPGHHCFRARRHIISRPLQIYDRRTCPLHTTPCAPHIFACSPQTYSSRVIFSASCPAVNLEWIWAQGEMDTPSLCLLCPRRRWLVYFQPPVLCFFVPGTRCKNYFSLRGRICCRAWC
jgi:hypothetical protein